MFETRTVKTTVRHGGKIEVTDPDLPEGSAVEITVRLADEEEGRKNHIRSVLDVLDECEGGVLFKSVEDVDSHIRKERESWDH